MPGLVDTRNASAVERHVRQIHLGLFPDADPNWAPKVLGWARKFFGGGYEGYQAIDARYHDLEHTFQGTVCLADLLSGRHRARARPVLTRADAELCLLGMLFHDTGYLKARGDTEGTGAKYTAIHVHRSAEFAAAFLAEQGYSPAETKAVENMIRCTGVNTDLTLIEFQSERERIGGWSLATADLLGQMAAPDYVDKLPELFEEFAEAVRFSGLRDAPFARFQDADDLLRKTPAFWNNYVWPRLQNEFGGVYKFLNDPYPNGPNHYVEQIEANLARLERA